MSQDRYERSDGSYVFYDHSTECSTSNSALPGHRGWGAVGPDGKRLSYTCRTTKKKRSRFPITIKYKTPEAALAALQKTFPI